MKRYIELSDILHVPSIDKEMVALAKRVKEIRRRRGYSQAQFADRSGVSLGSIKRFERTGEISLRHLWSIAEALEIGDELSSLFTAVRKTRKEIWGNEDDAN